MFLSNGVIIIP